MESPLSKRDSSIEFDELTKQIKPLRKFILKQVHRLDVVDDLVQETLLKAIQKINLYEGTAKFSSWLYQIATNTCIDWKRNWQRRKINQSLNIPASEDQDLEVLDLIQDENSNSEFLLIEAGLNLLKQKDMSKIISALNSLPTQQAIIIKLRMEGMKQEQIAVRQNISVNTVRSRYRYGLLKLREVLKIRKDHWIT